MNLPMIGAALVLLASPAFAASWVRGPYIEGVSEHSAYVCWRTDVDTEGALAWRLLPRGPESVVEDREPKRQRCLEAKPLMPAARHEYRVMLRQRGGPVSWSEPRAFRSPAQSTATIRFAAFGDTGMATPAQFEVARRLDEADPEFVLHSGDVVYPYGADADYDAKYFEPYARFLGRLPIYIALGNHDYANARFFRQRGLRRLRENFLAVHRLPRARTGGAWEEPPSDRAYYSFDWGPGHFVALDANRYYPIPAAPSLGPGSEQLAWLERDLADTKRPWKIVFVHLAVYSSGGHGTNEDLVRWLAPALERGGVDLVLQGHDHNYERTAPILGGKRAQRGPVYVTVGTGGAPFHRGRRNHYWTRVFSRVHGFLEVVLDPERLRARGVAADGATFDEFELVKPR